MEIGCMLEFLVRILDYISDSVRNFTIQNLFPLKKTKSDFICEAFIIVFVSAVETEFTRKKPMQVNPRPLVKIRFMRFYIMKNNRLKNFDLISKEFDG